MCIAASLLHVYVPDLLYQKSTTRRKELLTDSACSTQEIRIHRQMRGMSRAQAGNPHVTTQSNMQLLVPDGSTIGCRLSKSSDNFATVRLFRNPWLLSFPNSSRPLAFFRVWTPTLDQARAVSGLCGSHNSDSAVPSTRLTRLSTGTSFLAMRSV
ncbi:hypothetical protein N656DRAFT_580164 [Canariomyces notabilis]|uniref:Uncharacterized protein n=1 Tax=Canariomyces notabilis TaxID=2074819 RepID=A0AAN6TGZ6_9PEZI|nr:hypothetical protein N656DRAFT_580164 [Canariomyces arenarius]